MFHKLFLLIILVVNLLSLSLIMNIKSSFIRLSAPAEDKEKSTVPTFTPTQVISENVEMPLLWKSLTDRGITRMFLSYDQISESQAKELGTWMDNTPTVSTFISDKKGDLKKVDDESKKALMSMDIFTLLYSEGVGASAIVNQEYGIALSRDTPLLILINDEKDREKASAYGDILLITEENKARIAEEILKYLTQKHADNQNPVSNTPSN